MRGRHALNRIINDHRGVAGIEAAIVIPIMCLILLGFYETYAYVRAVALLERAAFSVADMMARQQSALIDCNTTDNALNLAVYMAAADKIVYPLSLSANGEVILSGVDAPAGTAVVRWQRHSSFTIAASSILGEEGENATLPDAGLTPSTTTGDTLLVAEIFYSYSPFAMSRGFMPSLPATVTISRQAYFHARTAALNTLGVTAGCPGL